mmetsp:Transcript_23236/g.66599  ORF Transcript_23236/g.66599 Transcript_23236/m.66599 type:complete len:82 (+) Transcript_23236:339-584(+)
MVPATTHTHTDTHTQKEGETERERQRQRERGGGGKHGFRVLGAGASKLLFAEFWCAFLHTKTMWLHVCALHINVRLACLCR